MLSITTQSLNQVVVEGQLAEITLDAETRNGQPWARVRGTVNVPREAEGVTHVINFESSSFRTSKNGAQSKLYDEILGLENVRRLSTHGEHAEKLHLFGNISAAWRDPKYWNYRVGRFQKEEELNPQYPHTPHTSVKVVGVLVSKEPEQDFRGQLTGRLKIQLAIIRFNGQVEPIDFVIEDPKVLDAFSHQTRLGDTVWVRGYIKAIPVQIKDGRTITPREIIITSHEVYDPERSYNPAEVNQALKDFYVRRSQSSTSTTPPAPTTPAASNAKSLYENTSTDSAYTAVEEDDLPF